MVPPTMCWPFSSINLIYTPPHPHKVHLPGRSRFCEADITTEAFLQEVVPLHGTAGPSARKELL